MCFYLVSVLGCYFVGWLAVLCFLHFRCDFVFLPLRGGVVVMLDFCLFSEKELNVGWVWRGRGSRGGDNMIKLCLKFKFSLNNKIYFKLVKGNQVLFLGYNMWLTERQNRPMKHIQFSDLHGTHI